MAAVIHVDQQPEPHDFDKKVRRKGLDWLRNQTFNIHGPVPKGIDIPRYWSACLKDLYDSYGGYCAYLAVFFELTTGGATVDHFIAKSSNVLLAYEWSNYRLSCSRMNSRKREYDDVLDPFSIEDGWFHLELVTGHIFPNQELSDEIKAGVQKTIDRLKLDDGANKEMRARHFQYYCEGKVDSEYLKKHSPFVWMEANRQHLL